MEAADARGGRWEAFAHGFVFDNPDPAIYWTPSTGAHAIYGQIRGRWASLGWEQSFLGYPTSDETGTPDGSGRFNPFQRGKINWTLAGGLKLEFSSLSFDWPDLGLSSVSGFAHLTVYSNGAYNFTGHIHDGGFWAYNTSVAWGPRANDGTLFQFLDTGHVQARSAPARATTTGTRPVPTRRSLKPGRRSRRASSSTRTPAPTGTSRGSSAT